MTGPELGVKIDLLVFNFGFIIAGPALGVTVDLLLFITDGVTIEDLLRGKVELDFSGILVSGVFKGVIAILEILGVTSFFQKFAFIFHQKSII